MRNFLLLLSAACCATALPREEIGRGIHPAFRRQYQPVVDAIVDVIESQPEDIIPLLVRMAWHTVAQFNAQSSIQGGSNGGCQRFNPEKSDPENTGLDAPRGLMEAVYERHPFVTRADLYILAGNTALEYAGAGAQLFRPGREDFSELEAATRCPLHQPRSRMPRKHENLDAFPHVDTLNYFGQKFAGELSVVASSVQEASRLRVALMGGHTLGGLHRNISGGNGKWTTTPFQFNNEYFNALVDRDWDLDASAPGTNEGTTPHDDLQYEEFCTGCPDGKLVMLPIDIILKHDADLFAAVKDFALNEKMFNEYFARAWWMLGANNVTFTDLPLAGEGLMTYVYQDGDLVTDFPSYESLTPVANGTSDTIDFNDATWLTFGNFVDNFASRHFGYLKTDDAGDHTLFITSDDGSQLFLEGQLLIDNGGLHGSVTASATVHLEPGLHTIDLQFFEAGGGAVVRFEWLPPGAAERAVVPKANLRVSATDFVAASVPPPPPVPPLPTSEGTGLMTYIYVGGDAMTGFPDFDVVFPVASFGLSTVNLNDAAWLALGWDMNFASRHVGSLVVEAAGEYTLYISSDDGSRLFLNGALLIDNGGNHGLITEQATLFLEVGLHALDVQYYDAGGNAEMYLEWAPPGGARAVIPAENLFGGGGTPAPPGAPPATPAPPGAPPGIPAPPPNVTPLPVPSSLQGLTMYLYSFPDGVGEFPAYESLTPDVVAGTPELNFDEMAFSQFGYKDRFATIHVGHLDVPEEGEYIMYLTSDDGSRMYLDGLLAINNGGQHGPQEVDAKVYLTAGLHPIVVQYFESGGSSDILRLEWDPPGASPRSVISVEYLVGGGIALTPAPTPAPTPLVACEKTDGESITSLANLGPGTWNYAVPAAATAGSVTVGSQTTLRITAGAAHSTLRFTCIVVEDGGWLEIGGDDCNSVLELVVEGNCTDETSGGIIVGNEGVMHMVGKQSENTWTTLTKPAGVGETTLQVVGDVQGWSIGDVIGIASTDYDSMYHETAIISAVGDGTLQLSSGLQYYHHGSDEAKTGGIDVEHAEVALLTRSIILRDGFVKTKSPSAVAIRGVLFEGSATGEAPFVAKETEHLSLVGNAFLEARRCAIFDGIHRSVIRDNVAFRCRGNCYMMMGPTSTLNTFDNNLAVATLFDPTSEYLMEREGASGFVMTNLDNTYVNNVVAGSDYGGFIFNVGTCEGYNTHRGHLRAFKGNRMHSTAQAFPFILGDNLRFDKICSDSAPEETLVFHDVVIWKIWGEGGHKRGNVVFKGGVWSDCAQGWQNFQGGTIPHVDADGLSYGQYEGSIFVGRSSNPGNINTTLSSAIQTCIDLPMERFNVVEKRCIPWTTERSALRSTIFIMYDGPTFFHSCAFVNIDGDKFCFAAPRYAANSFMMTVRHEVTNPSILDYNFVTGEITRSERDATSLLCRNRIGYEGEDRFMVAMKIADHKFMVPYEPAYYTPKCARTPWCQPGDVGGPEGGCFYVCDEKMVDIRVKVSVPQVLTLCRGDNASMCLDFIDGTAGGHVQFQFPVATLQHYRMHLPMGGEVRILLTSADAGDWVDFTIEGESGCSDRIALRQADYDARKPDARLVEVFDECRIRVKQVVDRRDFYAWCPAGDCTQVQLLEVSDPDLPDYDKVSIFDPADKLDADLLFGPDQCASNPCDGNACLWREQTFACIPLA
ncbi:putative heme-binding peroxidase [Diplonema papillatum]|nr:putative heme-binding peroxidase [Diplonema papillatum]